MASITNLNEAWEGHSGLEVENFIKGVLASLGTTKIGAYCFSTSADANNHYHLWGFATVADKTAYLEDPTGNAALLLVDEPLLISTVQQDTYVAVLASDTSTSPNYVVKAGSAFNVNLRYQSLHVIAATNTSENYGANGTLTVERSTDGGTTWETIEVRTVRPAEVGAENYPISLALGGQLLADRTNHIRIRASFQYVGEDGVTYTRSSSYITYIVSSVNLYATLATQWEVPITANNSTTRLALRITPHGGVAKVLHVEVDGSVSTATYTANMDATVNGSTVDVSITETAATRILSHGVHEVRTWLTASDGNGGTLTSDVAVNHIMVINADTAGADPAQPYLLLQGVTSVVPNFVQSRLCSYAVYSPGGDNIDIALLMTSSSSSILSVPQTEYFRLEATATPQTRYDLDVTVEMEQEAGATFSPTLQAYLHVTRNAGGTTYDFLNESSGAGYQVITVDNSSGFAPTAGSDFHLNPKTRNNTEADPRRILNARDNNAVIESEWTNFKLGNEDGWVTDDAGEKILRIPAGALLNIKWNPLSQMHDTPASSMTIEFDLKMWGITNEDDPIIRLCEQLTGGSYIGLRMRPLVGTFTTASNLTEETTDFRIQEDERTHVSINIMDAIVPNVILNGAGDGLTSAGTNNTTSIALVRVLVNGRINRELRFDKTNANEFCTGAMSNGGLYMGQEGAGIDIYGIRAWYNRQVTAQNIVQNRISTLPTAAEKIREKTQNDIMTSNRLDIEKVKALGKNYLIWHGVETYHQDQNSHNGFWEFGQYDAIGTSLPELSGTICKATASLKAKGQGTTAKTYYYWNLQTKLSDVTDTINVPLTDLHSSITVEDDPEYAWLDADNQPTGEVGAYKLKGGCLGKNFPLASESFVRYHKTTVNGAAAVVVPDGWVDGNGKYRGMGYQVATFLPLAQKLVLKVNYASSMQSHIVGVNRLYNDLHTLYVGKNALQNAMPQGVNAVVAKHLVPFLFFTQADASSAPVYRGPGTWGAGKMDKPSWGYVKSVYPNFCMIEGADNNMVMADMRAPWDDDGGSGMDSTKKVFYNPSEEAWYYRLADNTLQKSINFDGGKTVVGTDGKKYPHPDIVSYIRDTWNFLYLHNPRVRYYEGTYQAFLADNSTDKNYKYWCRSTGGNDSDDYKLKRWDYNEGAWVNAGLFGNDGYEEIDLMDASSLTYAAFMALTPNERADYGGKVNEAFISAIVADAKDNIGEYFVEKSVKFHYTFQNHFNAGTDNCSKNTYYVLVPFVINGSTRWKFEMHQDDVDTVLATDNSGLQSKPYYIDRMHPYADSDTTQSNPLYEGRQNVLFNLCEEMWENSLELQTALREILQHMAGLNATAASLSAESAAMAGCWGTLNKYIFDVQRYIPAMAFNEAARIRYEFPAAMGYTSDQRSVDPIEQSMGDQLQAELQWMKRRLVYMASYAAFGEFRPQGTGSTGLSDTADSFAMVNAALPDGGIPSFTFNLVPHQYIYPTAALAQSLVNNHVRVAPGDSHTVTITPAASGDDGVTIYAINYYRSIGNIGDNSYKPTSTLTVKGKRLTAFTAEPTRWYPTAATLAVNPSATYVTTPTDGYLPAFRCSGIVVNATGLKTLSFKGCRAVGGSAVNLAALTRLQSIDLRGTDIPSVAIPATASLSTLRLPATVTAVNLTAQPSLATFQMEGYGALQSLVITGSPLLATLPIVSQIYQAQQAARVLQTLRLVDVAWTSVMVEMLDFLAATPTCELAGQIDVYESGYLNAVTFAKKWAYIKKWGNVDDVTADDHRGLKLRYTWRALTGLTVKGEKYTHTTGQYGYEVTPASSYENGFTRIVFAVSPSEGLPSVDDDGYLELTWGGRVKMDTQTGILGVAALSVVDERVMVAAYATCPTAAPSEWEGASPASTFIGGSIEVGIFDRPAAVGDYLFSDGSYADADDSTKTPVAVVYLVVPDDDDQHLLFRADERQKRFAVALDDVTATGSDSQGNSTTFNEWQWGLYPAGNGSNSIQDSDNRAFVLQSAPGYTVYDPASTEDITSHGMGAVVDSSDPQNGSSSYIRDSNFRDTATTQGMLNNGFKCFTLGENSTTVGFLGDGFGYMEATARQDARDLSKQANQDLGLHSLLSQYWREQYEARGEEETFRLNSGYVKTLKIMAHRNKLLADPVFNRPIPAASGSTSELQSLANEMMAIRLLHNGESNKNAWSQLYFPAISACYAYEPPVAAGESLAPRLQKHNWFLPTLGHLGRLYWYHRQGYTVGTEHAIFAKAKTAGRFRQFPSSYYWSVSEYNANYSWYVYFTVGNVNSNNRYHSYRCRPVVAF